MGGSGCIINLTIEEDRIPEGSLNPGVRYPDGQTPEWATPVPGGRRSGGKRKAAVAVADPAAVKQLLRELKQRAGLSDAEVARRMGVSRQAITEVQNSFDTTDHPRKPSFLWVLRYATVCGARVILEFPGED